MSPSYHALQHCFASLSLQKCLISWWQNGRKYCKRITVPVFLPSRLNCLFSFVYFRFSMYRQKYYSVAIFHQTYILCAHKWVWVGVKNPSVCALLRNQLQNSLPSLCFWETFKFLRIVICGMQCTEIVFQSFLAFTENCDKRPKNLGFNNVFM